VQQGFVFRALALESPLPLEEARQVLFWRVGDALATHLYHPEHHFQRGPGADQRPSSSHSAFDAGLAFVDARMRAFAERAGQGELACAMIDLGRALHAVQDAAANSNLPELSFGQECLLDEPRGQPHHYLTPAAPETFATAWGCLARGDAHCKGLGPELRLVIFPVWMDPGRSGAYPAAAREGSPARLNCPDPDDPASCWAREAPDRRWRHAQQEMCREFRGSFEEQVPPEDAYLHPCFGSTWGRPFVGAQDHRIYDRARYLAQEASIRVLARAYEAVGDPTTWSLILRAEYDECVR
jgi:hypothetical protein